MQLLELGLVRGSIERNSEHEDGASGRFALESDVASEPLQDL